MQRSGTALVRRCTIRTRRGSDLPAPAPAGSRPRRRRRPPRRPAPRCTARRPPAAPPAASATGRRAPAGPPSCRRAASRPGSRGSWPASSGRRPRSSMPGRGRSRPPGRESCQRNERVVLAGRGRLVADAVVAQDAAAPRPDALVAGAQGVRVVHDDVPVHHDRPARDDAPFAARPRHAPGPSACRCRARQRHERHAHVLDRGVQSPRAGRSRRLVAAEHLDPVGARESAASRPAAC